MSSTDDSQKNAVKTASQSRPSVEPPREKEHTGSIWTHPYMIYIVLTVMLFLLLCGLGYLAWVNEWIPNRRTS
jgi:hypothetical protein